MSASEETAPWWAFIARALLGAGAELLREAAVALPAVPGLPDPADIRALLGGEPVEFEREYVWLFLRPEGAPCPPWQSAWEAEPQLMGSTHMRALEWYRQAGVEPQAANEPADHAGLLAAFWAGWLLENADAAARQAFFREHLAWMDRLAAAIMEHARHPFFATLGLVLRTLVAEAARETAQPASASRP